MNELKLNAIGNIKQFINPASYTELSLKSPALAFFTDFSVTKPLVIESNLSAVETMLLMKKTHVRLKFVLNAHDDVVGIVSADDIIERKLVQKLGKGDKREDLLITDFMTPREKLRVFEYKDLVNTNISHVIKALKDSGQQHCLVVETEKDIIRGIFSVSDISRKLQIAIDVQDQPSFSKLASKVD